MTIAAPSFDTHNGCFYEFEQTTIQFKCEHSAATESHLWRLFIQSCDSYGYLWEFIVQYRYEPGNSKKLYWEFTVYRHAGWRKTERISQKLAEGIVKKILERCEKDSVLLFNPASVEKGRNAGLIQFFNNAMLCDPLTEDVGMT